MANITCYGFDGTAFPDNKRCPGSNSCCSTVSQCTKQRLCQKSTGQLIRPACANKPYTNSTCAQLCQYDEGGPYLPRITTCIDGTFCCDKNPNCCANGLGITLNDIGQVVGPLSKTASSTSSSTSSISTKATSSTSISAKPSSSQVSAPHSSGLSTGAKAGIGVAVSLGVIIAACLVALIFIQRRRLRLAANKGPVAPSGTSTASDQPITDGEFYSNPDQQPQQKPIVMSELENTHRPMVAEMDDARVNEGTPLNGSTEVWELDGGNRRTS